MTKTYATGGQWATHFLIVWLSEHPSAWLTAADIADGDKVGYGDRELRDWFEDVLYHHPDFAAPALLYAERRSLVSLREQFTRDDFNEIEWSVVRHAVLGQPVS